MATNQKYEDGDQLSVAVTAPTTPSSGDPVLFGVLPGVALTDEDDDGNTTVAFKGVYNLSVKAESGNITPSTALYYDSADANLNDASSGNTAFGFALGSVTSGATATIPVKIQSF